MAERLCIGPDGGNLLGFLAALGALVTLDRAWPDSNARMKWMKAGPWRPVLQVDGDAGQSELVSALEQELRKRTIEVTRDDGKLACNTSDLTPIGFHYQARQACQVASPTERLRADFLSALASDAVTDRYDEEKVEDTALRTLNGAGRQDFFRTMRNLVETTTPEDIETTLFRPWEYREGRNTSLRYDPREDRRYALRATDPGKEEVKTVRGANRLAVEAFVCFPTFPAGGRLKTVCFVDNEIAWPIWDTPLSRGMVQSLLLRSELYSQGRGSEKRDTLRAIGVAQVYKSSRINTGGGRFRNFTVARPCM